MRNIIRASLALALGGLAACAEGAPDPVSPKAPPGARHDYGAADVWNMADVEADFGSVFSLDSTQSGTDANFQVSYDVTTGDGTFCRDHFNALDLWWDGGHGLMSFHMDPPILFVSYRAGTFTSPRKLIFRRAVYETLGYSLATDPAGNQWRFHGRFNALCRGGEFEIGPLVFGGQIVVAQDPIDRPVLVRQACNDGGSGGTTAAPSNADGSLTTSDIGMDPSYDPYGTYDPGGGSCEDSGGSGGTGGGTGGGGSVCHTEVIAIEISNDDGMTWETWWEGYATVCEK